MSKQRQHFNCLLGGELSFKCAANANSEGHRTYSVDLVLDFDSWVAPWGLVRSETVSVPFLDTWFTVLTWTTASFSLLWLPACYQRCMISACMISLMSCSAWQRYENMSLLEWGPGIPTGDCVCADHEAESSLTESHEWCKLHWSESKAWFWLRFLIVLYSGFDSEVLMWPQKPLVSKLAKLKVSFNCAIVTDLQFLFFNHQACDAFSETCSTCTNMPLMHWSLHLMPYCIVLFLYWNVILWGKQGNN